MTAAQPLRCLLVSDFNIDNLAGTLRGAGESPAIAPVVAPFGAVYPTLLDAGQAVWAEAPDAACVWTRPDGVLESVRDVLEGDFAAADRVEADVDGFADAVLAAAERVRWMVVPTWTVPFGQRALGPIDRTHPAGLRATLARANARLAARLAGAPGCFVPDADRWLAAAGPEARSRRLWYLAKVPFGPAVFHEAAADLQALFAAGLGRTRKLIILDLDNTLWGGIVGDVGWEGLRLGGHDPIGEAFQDFQRALKALSARGIILAIASKNEEATALGAIRQHPEMVLREADFAGWRINWQDKAANIADLVAELNLGLDACVFLDDQPAERGRVADALPGVLVPDWPSDPLRYVEALDALRCFDAVTVSAEDARRAGTYAAERERRALRASVGSVDEWLASLEVTVTVAPLDQATLPRAAQLLNKTNQMNLTTRRIPEGELWTWASEPGRAFWTFRVADRYADAGLTGLLSVERDGHDVRIVDFVLSCRVFGRRVEDAMLWHAASWGQAAGATSLSARLVDTDRNAPTRSFFAERSGMVDGGDSTWTWDLAAAYPAPDHVRIAGAEQAPAASR